MRLSELNPGDRAVVKAVTATSVLGRRLMDMGLLRGSEVSVIRKAPLGDPVEVEVKGYRLSLRVDEARNVLVDAVRSAHSKDARFKR